ncbi:MAG: hypothetical protein H6561_11515 [Lewinellaceae bacterium]|nr:hypothetical protein [Lewinellaceae bacterium]
MSVFVLIPLGPKVPLSCHSAWNELKQKTFHYFWDLADPEFGQMPDRYPSLTFSSIAATGFGLSAYITGIENGYISTGRRC